MIEGFNIKDAALGTGDTVEYTFDFKITDPTHLLIYVQDDSGAVVQKIRGDDTDYLASLAYDSIDGGGTITLVDDLPSEYVMTMLLAPDEPDQPTAFPNKTSFSLDILEGVLDLIASQIQRVAYLAQRAIVLHDLDDIDAFDPTLPLGISDNPGGIVSVNEDGSGFEFVVTTGMIESAEGYAALAAASEAAAAISAADASTSADEAAASAAAALSGVTVYGTRALPLDITAAGGITSHTTGSEQHYVHGSPGAVIITANPQISPGTVDGQILRIVGRDDTNTLKFSNGNGLSLNGDCTLGEDDVLNLYWDTVNWVESSRRSAT